MVFGIFPFDPIVRILAQNETNAKTHDSTSSGRLNNKNVLEENL